MVTANICMFLAWDFMASLGLPGISDWWRLAQHLLMNNLHSAWDWAAFTQSLPS